MKIIFRIATELFMAVLLLGNPPVISQEVLIPDPGLNAAVRQALQKPNGPLSEQDLLTLTNLDASRKNIRSLTGLESARHLAILNLEINQITNVAPLDELSELTQLNLSVNPLTTLSLSTALTNLTSLVVEADALTNLTIPANLIRLNALAAGNNNLTKFDSLSNLTSLIFLDLGFNSLTNFTLPPGLTNLETLLFAANELTQFSLPEGMKALTSVNLSQNQFASFSLPAGLTNLIDLNLFFNQLTNVTLPNDLTNLIQLDLSFNRLTNLVFPPNLNQLASLHLRSNYFTSFTLPAELTMLKFLDVSGNQLNSVTLPVGLHRLHILRLSENRLTNLRLPVGLSNLTGLHLTANQLTNLILPPDLHELQSLNLGGNQLATLSLPSGLTNVIGLFVTGNLLTKLTIPRDMARLINFGFLGNPLSTFVLPEKLVENLAVDISALENQGVSVFTYRADVELIRVRQPIGAFQFAISGPPATYSVLASTNLSDWTAFKTLTNELGNIVFTDTTANLTPQKFYRAIEQTPPPNMVHIPPSTFTMGSPANELHRATNEGPQTIVTLTRGFWIGKFEVTQAEYLSIMHTNPSSFPGDLTHPISSVSWSDATNYCAKLTKRELAAGRISAGSVYRLPTEAEWECAARAGTTTRFSFGDDLTYSSLTNHAWINFEGGMTVHPVGQKLPNPWGLYDMEGNVFEWCLDWLGPLSGGAIIDPIGPDSNPIGWRVMRGGAFDFSENSCRSAARNFFASHPALNDWNLGFRVVLATEK